MAKSAIPNVAPDFSKTCQAYPICGVFLETCNDHAES